jgi:type II secretion system protein I
MNHRRGFTLIEVLVALIIVALGAAAVLTALRTAADSAQRQRERMLAGQVAMNPSRTGVAVDRHA